MCCRKSLKPTWATSLPNPRSTIPMSLNPSYQWNYIKSTAISTSILLFLFLHFETIFSFHLIVCLEERNFDNSFIDWRFEIVSWRTRIRNKNKLDVTCIYTVHLVLNLQVNGTTWQKAITENWVSKNMKKTYFFITNLTGNNCTNSISYSWEKHYKSNFSCSDHVLKYQNTYYLQ